MSTIKKRKIEQIVELMKKVSYRHKENKHVLTDHVVASFLQQHEHSELLTKVMDDPCEENLLALDTAFREHYTEIRFIKYVSLILFYEAIHYDQRLRKRQERMQLILDQPARETSEDTILEKLATYTPNLEAYSSLEDQITSREVHHAFLTLTARQKMILQLTYGDHLLDTDIATQLGISQQAVSQSRRAALKKLKQILGGKVK